MKLLTFFIQSGKTISVFLGFLVSKNSTYKIFGWLQPRITAMKIRPYFFLIALYEFVVVR